jgi:hypothetical protein
VMESFKCGSMLIIYQDFVIICRRGRNSISVMIPNVILNNIKIYVKKYIQ